MPINNFKAELTAAIQIAKDRAEIAAGFIRGIHDTARSVPDEWLAGDIAYRANRARQCHEKCMESIKSIESIIGRIR